MTLYIVKIKTEDSVIEAPQTTSFAQAQKYKRELDEEYSWQGHVAHIWAIEM